MAAANGLEIERKFLIRYPGMLEGEVWDIEQTYLASKKGETRRVRRIVNEGREAFFYTEKRRVTDVTREEREREISRAEYDALLCEREEKLKTIRKRRVRIPEGDLIWEIDLFDFWRDRAILEVELSSEDEDFTLPPFVDVIREVTHDKRYTNRAMAKKIPVEEIK